LKIWNIFQLILFSIFRVFSFNEKRVGYFENFATFVISRFVVFTIIHGMNEDYVNFVELKSFLKTAKVVTIWKSETLGLFRVDFEPFFKAKALSEDLCNTFIFKTVVNLQFVCYALPKLIPFTLLFFVCAIEWNSC
jgi:hypothetical protein